MLSIKIFRTNKPHKLLLICAITFFNSTIGQVRYINEIVSENGNRLNNIYIQKLLMSGEYTKGVLFTNKDTCDCKKYAKVKVYPGNATLYQSEEMDCPRVTSRIVIKAVGSFAGLRPITTAYAFDSVSLRDSSIETYHMNDSVQQTLIKILSAVKLTDLITEGRILAEAADIPNAQAIMSNGRRYIIYNPAIIHRINNNDWPSIGIFAHELAHHIKNHDVAHDTLPEQHRKLELEADNWAGFLLSYMGADSTAIKPMVDSFLSSGNASFTHPGKAERWAQIRAGFIEGEQEKVSKSINLEYSKHLRKGRVLYDKKQYSSAINEFDTAITQNRFATDAYLYRGISYEKKARHTEAIADLSKYISFDSTNLEAYQYRGFSYVLLGQSDPALSDADKAFAINKNNALNYALRGVGLTQKTKYIEAIKYLDSSLRLDQTHGLVQFYKGFAYGNLNNNDSAVFYYDQALALDTSAWLRNNAYTYKAISNMARGGGGKPENYDSALNDINQALELSPQNPTDYFYRGQINTARFAHRDAIADYTMALSIQTAADVYVYRGACRLFIKQFDSALIDFKTALVINPDHPNKTLINGYIVYTSGQVDLVNGDYNSALQKGDSALRINLMPVEYYEMAQALIGLKRYSEALQNTEKANLVYNALTNKSAFPFYLNALAKYGARNYPDAEVLDDINKAIEYNNLIDDKASYYYLRAQVYYKMGNQDAACKDLDVAKTLMYKSAVQDNSIKCK